MIKFAISTMLILPLIVAAGVFVLHGIPDAVFDGDGALLEIGTRAALEGDQFTGPYSRGGFNHPGPLYFYLLAPLYWLTNGSALSLYVTAILLNLLSLAGIVIMVWQCTNTWAAIWLVLLCSAYLNFLGPAIFLSIWNPYVTILAFLFSVMCFASVAIGKIGYLPLAVFASSFVVQTHLGYAPAIFVMAVFALGCCALPIVRRIVGINSSYSTKPLPVLVFCIVLCVILWALPVIEQWSESPGNISKLAHFFTENPGSHSWNEVYRTACGVFSQYTLSVFGKAHPTALWVPQGHIPWFLHVILWGQGVLLVIAYVFARRQHQDYFVALAVLCGALSLVSVLSLKRIVGPILDYLVVWMTGLSVITWTIVGGVGWQTLGEIRNIVRGRVWQWLVMGLTALVLIWITARNGVAFFNESQRIVTTRNTNTFTHNLDHIEAKVLDLFHHGEIKTCLVRTLDFEAWPAVAGLILKMTKAGIAATVDPQWPARYPSRYALTSVPPGMLLVCRPETGARLQQLMPLTLVAQTTNCMVFWQSFHKGLEGHFLFETLPALAFTYQGFSKTGYVGGRSFRWSSARESMMSIPLEQGKSYKLGLTMSIPQKIKAIVVFLNGHKLTEFEFPQAWRWQEYRVRLPGEYVQALNRLTFRYRYQETPENPSIEGRQGSLVAFESMTLEKIEE
jgi:hypothetical protein